MLYLEAIQKEENDTLYTFLLKCIESDGNYKTFGTFPKTYFDPELKNTQCIGNKRRSFDDILEISKTYFDTSPEEVAKTIKKLMDYSKEIEKSIGFLFCDDANKWILHDKSYVVDWDINDNYIISYNRSKDKMDMFGRSDYCMNDILKLMDHEIIE